MDEIIFPPTAQGIGYDRHGFRVRQKPAQVAGHGPSGFVPVTSEPPPGQNWNPSYIGSEAYLRNARLKKEEYERIKKWLRIKSVDKNSMKN